MYTKNHLISILWYIGIGFISGSISHGFFSGTRSVIMALIGVLIFIIAEYLKGWDKNYTHLILGWLVFSVAIGMVSWGFQHFLDSPMRSLWIIPVWWFVSTIIFPYKEWLQDSETKKSIIVGLLISLLLWVALYGAIHILPESIFVGWDHHAQEDVVTSTGH